MTADSRQGDRELWLAAGTDDHATKPIRADQPVDALQDVTARSDR
jgi:CheY-like chemotaxis protein